MCLIIHKPEHVEFNEKRLRDFWDHNRDGAGIMWHNGACVDVEKIVAPTEDEWVEFYNEFARGRECLIHLRWRTHGAVDEDNTHPYYINRGFWLMHNGVLSTGNAADKSKSDTWHFIEDVLKPALRKNRGCFRNNKFRVKLGKVIGRNNKFAILGTNNTKPIIINKNSGIMWKGAWFSNTYAWTAPGVRYVAAEPERAYNNGNPPPRYYVPKTWSM